MNANQALRNSHVALDKKMQHNEKTLLDQINDQAATIVDLTLRLAQERGLVPRAGPETRAKKQRLQVLV